MVQLKAYDCIMCVELMDVLAPFSSMLVNKYGHRKIVIVGGALAAVGMTLSYFAVDLWILFITYGVIFGSGAGLLMVPSVSILPSYFEKRLSLAFGLVTVGTGLGSFCFPYIVQLLLDEYDYRNQFLVCGALTFNVIAAGLVFSPLRPSSSAAASADAGDGNTPRSDEKSRDKTVAGGGSDEKSRDKTVAGGGGDEKSRDKTVAGGG
ncbi:PREDICTED: monocarboxylate transporter 14-like [Priapulus caudatus]|uniref:Monocarboxylate transporter 14-like n=1 Tax=Priapulus caudatus TaxID=37621 RepID=A0ABM1EMW2_PRICU|nr:PREDICTED: monocarboxylate transporter 14-like [Priapulus caudatus]